MNPPYRLGRRLPASDFEQIKREMIIRHCKWDFQSDDHCVLADFPLILPAEQITDLFATAEKLAHETIAAEAELFGKAKLWKELALPRDLIGVLRAGAVPSRGLARVMRFDFHYCEEGWRISEVNADVPGGFIEASAFNALMANAFAGSTAPPDAAVAYAAAISPVSTDASIALVHATAYTEDRQVMLFLGKILAERGARCLLLAPDHLRWSNGQALGPPGEELHAIVRFFPGEWLPTIGAHSKWNSYFVDSRTPISNPATALFIQSKRFPVTWDSLSTSLDTWRRLLPETRAAERQPAAIDDWVIKSAFGRVGDSVAIPGVTAAAEFDEFLRATRRNPGSWVFQRRFSAVGVAGDDGDYFASIGIYVVDGKAAGTYGRISRKPLIDHEAQDVAILVEQTGE